MEQDGHYREIAFAQLYGDEERPKEAAPKAPPKSEHPSHMKRVGEEEVVAAATADVPRTEAEEPLGK
jgi:hypothetical protein